MTVFAFVAGKNSLQDIAEVLVAGLGSCGMRHDGLSCARSLQEGLWGLICAAWNTDDNADETLREDSAAERRDIAASKHGDAQAYDRIVARYQSTIADQLWRFSRDKAVTEELVHEVFVEAWLSLRKFKALAPFEHWLRRIAIRVGYRYWKNRERERRRHPPVFNVDVATSAVHEEIFQASELVHHILGKLPLRDRLVMTLLYLDQCTVAEAADRLGWSQSMVKVQAHRARRKLKKILNQIGN